MVALQGRCGRPQHQRNALVLRPLPSHLPGVITGGRFLLERILVFFVNHQQSQMGCGREDGTASAHDDRHAAAGNLFPVAMPLSVAEVAVQHGNGAEPLAKPGHRLRREADFRHQHDRLPAVADHFANRVHVDFRLAAAGDSVHQNRFVPAAAQGFANPLEGLLLSFVQVEEILVRRRRLLDRAAGDPLDLAGNQSLAAEGRDGRLGTAGRGGQFVAGHGCGSSP